ncbi:hypothetical protein SAMN02746066_04306 [Anaerosporobacter mobilis DSM 15930]|jgi:acyl carrier protein|uniref:Uncharacterized protein n=1 Tax=Anaerosporobacter mobilis DSM 15930 TaxID=1120996 RepID=A0A1M7N947_9FIRM|nr:hypothetical protein [Anaerosporobacter mobilis]SHN00130.1 hypothetical protein SAMN02746066_04306 [Anaerosporobacter mobilis DSM 15930]
MMNAEIVERIQIIKSEIFKFFESEIMWASMDEYLSSSVDLVELILKLEERYGFASEIEEDVANTVQNDNVRRYLWVGTQKIEMSGYRTLRVIADAITVVIAEEVEIVNFESFYYRELSLDDWICIGEQPNTFQDMISAVSRNRFCDAEFAGLLKNAGFIVERADYSGCKNTYYVEVKNGQRIWFEDIIVKNEDILIKYRRPRIEILQNLVNERF